MCASTVSQYSMAQGLGLITCGTTSTEWGDDGVGASINTFRFNMTNKDLKRISLNLNCRLDTQIHVKLKDYPLSLFWVMIGN